MMGPTQPPIIRRWLDAFVALPDRLRLPLALLLAVLLHGLIVVVALVLPLLVALLVELSLLPTSCSPVARKTVSPPERAQLEITIMTPTPTPAPEKEEPLKPAEAQQLEQMFAALPAEIQREYLDVEGLARRKNLSKRALMESWEDSVAGSRKQGSGDGPLPTQDGREDLPFTNFKNQSAIVGDPKKDAAEPSERTPRIPDEKLPGVEPAPIFKPSPVEKSALNSATADNIPKVAEAKPPKPTPEPTPEPAEVTKSVPPPPGIREVEKAADDEIPMFIKAPMVMAKATPPRPRDLEPEPTAKPTPVPEKPTPVPTPKPTALPTPKPASEIRAAKLSPDPTRPMPVKDPGYSPHLAMRKIDGGKAPAGDNGVDTVATTRGRYVKALNQAVGSRWTYYVRDPRQASLITVGSVTIKFSIDARAKLVRMKVTENTSNGAYAALCERALLESLPDFDKPPAELLRGGIFEDTFTFTLY